MERPDFAWIEKVMGFGGGLPPDKVRHLFLYAKEIEARLQRAEAELRAFHRSTSHAPECLSDPPTCPICDASESDDPEFWKMIEARRRDSSVPLAEVKTRLGIEPDDRTPPNQST